MPSAECGEARAKPCMLQCYVSLCEGLRAGAGSLSCIHVDCCALSTIVIKKIIIIIIIFIIFFKYFFKLLFIIIIIIIIIINLLSKALQDAILHCLSAFSSMVYIEMK